MSNLIVTLTGPTCSGKSTLEAKLRERGFASLISTTTRQSRAGEVDGKHYYFTDRSQFKRLAEQGAFIERVEFNGNFYGVTKSECIRAFNRGQPVVVVVEPEGFRQIKETAKQMGWRHVGVFVDICQRRQLERFFLRTAADFRGDGELTEKEAQTLMSRIRIILTDEQEWRKEAKASFKIDEPSYSLYLNEFGPENEETAIALICGYCESTPGVTQLAA